MAKCQGESWLWSEGLAHFFNLILFIVFFLGGEKSQQFLARCLVFTQRKHLVEEFSVSQKLVEVKKIQLDMIFENTYDFQLWVQQKTINRQSCVHDPIDSN